MHSLLIGAAASPPGPENLHSPLESEHHAKGGGLCKELHAKGGSLCKELMGFMEGVPPYGPLLPSSNALH